MKRRLELHAAASYSGGMKQGEKTSERGDQAKNDPDPESTGVLWYALRRWFGIGPNRIARVFATAVLALVIQQALAPAEPRSEDVRGSEPKVEESSQTSALPWWRKVSDPVLAVVAVELLVLLWEVATAGARQRDELRVRLREERAKNEGIKLASLKVACPELIDWQFNRDQLGTIRDQLSHAKRDIEEYAESEDGLRVWVATTFPLVLEYQSRVGALDLDWRVERAATTHPVARDAHLPSILKSDEKAQRVYEALAEAEARASRALEVQDGLRPDPRPCPS